MSQTFAFMLNPGDNAILCDPDYNTVRAVISSIGVHPDGTIMIIFNTVPDGPDDPIGTFHITLDPGGVAPLQPEKVSLCNAMTGLLHQNY